MVATRLKYGMLKVERVVKLWRSNVPPIVLRVFALIVFKPVALRHLRVPEIC